MPIPQKPLVENRAPGICSGPSRGEMAVQLTAPGVYVQEVSSGVRVITGVATSVTAFLGPCRQGETSLTSAPTRIASWAEFERSCGGLSLESDLSYAVRQFFLNGGGVALIVRVVHVDPDDPAASAAAARLTFSGGLVLEARSPGTWANQLSATVSLGGTLDPVESDGFHLIINDGDEPVETFPFLSVTSMSNRYVTSVLESQSRLVRVAAGISFTRPPAGPQASRTEGRDGGDVTPDDVIAAAARLDLADTVNLVLVPPFAAGGVSVAPRVYEALLPICERLRAMLLVDPPDSWVDYEAASEKTDVTGLQSPNVVMVHPRVQASDPLRDGALRKFAPSGFLAGVIARTDAERGVWKAPAGVDARLRGVSALTESLTDDRIGVLNRQGVNALAPRPVVGPVVWGSRTSHGADTRASEWKYVPVRRTALYIEESLRRGLQWVVFEPNDEPLWAQIRLAVGTFMQRLFEAGAFQGTTPRSAYLVQCDATTTTQADIDRGIVNIVVGFAPLKPAEFVILKFQQIAGQSGR